MTYLTGLKKINIKFKILCWFFVSIISTACSNNVFALKLNYGYSQSYEDTSNATHVADINNNGQAEDTIQISTVFMKLKENTTALKSSVELEVNYRDYVNNISDDTTQNTLKSEFVWLITPGYYSWYLSENINQTQTDPALPESETNTQEVNTFSTGPKLEWKIGASSLKFDTFINDYIYENTDDDSTSITSSLRWGNVNSSGFKYDLESSTKIVSFKDETIHAPYDQSSLGFNFKYDKQTYAVEVFFGETFLNSEEVTDTIFESEEVTLKRKLTRYSSVKLSYTNGISDKSDSIASGGTALSGLNISQNTSLSYERASNTFGMSLKYYENEKTAAVNGSSESKVGSQLTLSRILAARSRVEFSYSELVGTIDVGSANYEDTTYVTKLSYLKKFNNKISFSLYSSNTENKSTDVLRQYADYRVGVTISIIR